VLRIAQTESPTMKDNLYWWDEVSYEGKTTVILFGAKTHQPILKIVIRTEVAEEIRHYMRDLCVRFNGITT
jgi:hypothetical protein